ncbi:MAG: glycosyltransferase family 2 protein [Terriglobia bacterium]|jgi:glycosyltransferase involved in cell wall biosynthesis
MPDIRFSIVITSYNQPEFIKDAVDSALVQRTAEKEIIVVDDASTEGTLQILRQYGDAIRLVPLETNQGACVARNCGAAVAAGEYLVFLDGDDALVPWALDVYERIVQAKKPKMILGSRWWFKGMLPVLQPGDAPDEMRIVEYEDILRRDWPFGEPSAKVIDRHAFLAVQGWSPDTWPAEHTDLLLRLCISGPTILIFTPRTIFYRMHSRNNSANIADCIPALLKTIENERSGEYAGGKARCFERQALIGGRILSVAEKTFEAGLVWDAAKFLARGWPMAWVAVTRRLRIALQGRQLCETIKM